MNTEREIIGGEHRKIGNEHIEQQPFISPEKQERIITEDGLVKYGKEIQKLIREEGNKAKTGAEIVLKHVTGTSPLNLAFMKQSGVDQKLAETAQKIDILVETRQKEIRTITEDDVII